MHASALEEIAERTDDPEGLPTIDIGGLDKETLNYLTLVKFDKNLGFNRVEVIIHMIQTLIVHKQQEGIIKIPPPILSRVFQTISRGQVNLANCSKITHTLFPFPYAQMISLLLVCFSIFTPLVMSSLSDSEVAAFFLTMIPVGGAFAVNLIAREIELPFGDDANDLPMLAFQMKANNYLLMLIRTEADLVPCLSDQATTEWLLVKDRISTKKIKDFVKKDFIQMCKSGRLTVHGHTDFSSANQESEDEEDKEEAEEADI
jgi:hypothetical protein